MTPEVRSACVSSPSTPAGAVSDILPGAGAASLDEPRKALSVIDATAIIVGIVIGAGIFRTPSLVAENAGSATALVLLWCAGGLISLIGALCYAELTTTYPSAGGDYHFLKRAFGPHPAFLFAWARVMVIQTGSVAMMAFLLGDYLTNLWSLGPFSSSIYACIAVVALTAVNIAGIDQGKWTQNALTLGIVLGLLLVTVAGLFLAKAAPAEAAAASSGSASYGWRWCSFSSRMEAGTRPPICLRRCARRAATDGG
jgi:amino acid transporter